jgi:HK97 family phage portal protein
VSIATALTRVIGGLLGKAGLEGQYRPGPYYLPVTGGWLSAEAGQFMNWWQLGYDVTPASSCSAMVEACVSAYSQTTAMLQGDHWRANDKGGRDRITNSALSRILRKPNAYQSISDFMLNSTRSLYLEGNAYALALRNDRFEVNELHLMNPRQCAAQLATNGEVFYHLGGNEIIDKRIEPPLIVPQRDVLHIRLHTTRNQLKGESPLVAAAMDVAAIGAMTRQQLAFYTNQARPSFILSTDQLLSPDETERIRAKWNEQSKGLNQGGTPIMHAGLKPIPIQTSANDAKIADIMKLTEQHIALAYRIPLQLLGIGETPFASTEALMQFWLASGLGFCLNHIEEAFGQLFQLRGVPEEYVEFDTAALLRSAEKDRMEALAKSISGGIRTINEARATEGLSEVEGGSDIRVQQQDVPLDWHDKQQPKLAAPPAAPALPPPSDEDKRDANDNLERIRSGFRAAHSRNIAI